MYVRIVEAGYVNIISMHKMLLILGKTVRMQLWSNKTSFILI